MAGDAPFPPLPDISDFEELLLAMGDDVVASGVGFPMGFVDDINDDDDDCESFILSDFSTACSGSTLGNIFEEEDNVSSPSISSYGKYQGTMKANDYFNSIMLEESNYRSTPRRFPNPILHSSPYPSLDSFPIITIPSRSSSHISKPNPSLSPCLNLNPRSNPSTYTNPNLNSSSKPIPTPNAHTNTSASHTPSPSANICPNSIPYPSSSLNHIPIPSTIPHPHPYPNLTPIASNIPNPTPTHISSPGTSHIPSPYLDPNLSPSYSTSPSTHPNSNYNTSSSSITSGNTSCIHNTYPNLNSSLDSNPSPSTNPYLDSNIIPSTCPNPNYSPSSSPIPTCSTSNMTRPNPSPSSSSSSSSSNSHVPSPYHSPIWPLVAMTQPSATPLHLMHIVLECPSMQKSQCTQELGQHMLVKGHTTAEDGGFLMVAPKPCSLETLGIYLQGVNQIASTAITHKDNGMADTQTLNVMPRSSCPPSHGNLSSDEANVKIQPYTLEERMVRLNRYRLKRPERNFDKKVKYDCRKILADRRPRIRGRFARNDDTEESP